MRKELTQEVCLLNSCMSLGKTGTKIDPWPILGNVALRVFFSLLIDNVAYARIHGALLRGTTQDFVYISR